MRNRPPGVRAGGPAYIKLGQFIASADGLLPAEWVQAFGWCRDEAPPLPGDVVETVLRTHLGERFSAVRDFDPSLLSRECFICQPASFLRRTAFENVGGMDPELEVTFDYELWMRVSRLYTMRRIHATLAHSRMHPDNKSLGRRREVFHETFRVLRRHYGYVPFQWIYGYLCYRADGRDQFFEPFQPSLLRYLESLPMGVLVNRGAAARYLGEWLRVMSWSGLRRRLRPG